MNTVSQILWADSRLLELEGFLKAHPRLLIAYSGGVDSTFLLAVAWRVLGRSMMGVLADSPSLPRRALADALELAAGLGIPVKVLKTEEFQDERYTSNPINRCYFCKAELFLRMEQYARQEGFSALAYGENADDVAAERPGSKAAGEFRVLSPLKEAGLTKASIRELSARLGLPTADAPAQPCLSSRIPHGTPVTLEALHRIEQAEDALRDLGFRVFRVRLREPGPGGGAGATVLLAPDEAPRGEVLRQEIVKNVTASGFEEIDFGIYQGAGLA